MNKPYPKDVIDDEDIMLDFHLLFRRQKSRWNFDVP